MRTCEKCKLEKPLNAFGVDRSRPLGRKYVCRACKNIQMKELRKLNHPEAQRARSYARQWMRDHAEDAKRWNGEFRANNPGYYESYMRDYYARNKDRWANTNSKRRLAKATAFRPGDQELLDLVMREACDVAHLREMITGKKWHIDHMVPLRGKTVSGFHNEFNLAVIPAKANIAKSNRYWPDMPESK